MAARLREGGSARAVSALYALDPGCDRATWIKVGMSAKADGVEFADFDAWSRRAENYGGRVETRRVWDSFSADGGIGPGTLFRLAKESGWRDETACAGEHGRPELMAVPSVPRWSAVPESAPPIPRAHPRLGAPSATWTYRDSEGRALFHVCRFDTGIDRKEVLPLTYDGKSWQWKGLDAPRPLYGLDRLAAAPDDLVIVCEGEKAADAAGKLIAGAVAITSPNGAQAAGSADWTPLRGRRVIVWADFDSQGEKYAQAVAERAVKAGATVIGSVDVRKLVEGRELPEGWDAADALTEGMNALRPESLPLVKLARAEADAGPIAKPRGGFEFVRVGELLCAGLKPVQWLVRNYFEADSLALMFGDPGCGKSFAAIDLACCVATGTPWHGNKTTPGAVFYVAGEGKNGLARRFAAWSQHNGVSLADAELFTAEHAAQLCNEVSAADVASTIDRLQSKHGRKPALIVVDTLARNFGGDENNQEDMGAFVSNLDLFLRRSGEWGATVLIVHHSGHADKTRGRGSSALKGAVDAEYSLSKDEDGVVRMEATKMKDAEQPDPVAFKLQTVELDGLFDDEGQPVTSSVLWSVAHVPPAKAGKTGRGKNQTLALSILGDLIREHRAKLERGGFSPNGARVTLDEWRDRLRDAGFNKYRLRDIQASLKDAGLIAVESGGFVRLTNQSDEGPL